MKKKYFDGRLYREGLRQLRGMGIVMLVLFGLAAMLIPVGQAISLKNSVDVLAGYSMHVGYLEINLPILFTFTTAAPLLALKLFRFLDHRETSDFYHAIPQTRTCLFISFFAALVSWIVVLVVLPALISLFFCAVFSRYLELSPASVFGYSWHLLAASLLVAAAVVLAMSLTGTVFTNVAVAALILFLPRLLMTVILSAVHESLPYVANAPQTGFLDYRMNIVSGTVFGVILGNPLETLGSTRSGLYTLALAVIYTLLGCHFFRLRRSESAGQAAVSRRMQLVFRLTVALVICLVPIVTIFSKLLQGEAMLASEWFFLVVFYLIAILAYLLYELIATKKWGNLLKSLPGLGILAILNLVCILGMYGYSRYQSTIRPDAQEISYVQMLPDNTSSYSFVADVYGVSETQDYFRSQEARVEISDPEVLQLIAERLEETIDYYERNGNDRLFENYQFRPVAIHTGIRTIYRNIWLRNSDLEAIDNVLKQDATVREHCQQLPDLEENRQSMEVWGSLTSDCMEQVYDTLRQEVAAMDFEEWYAILSKTGEIGNHPMLYMSLQEENQTYLMTLHLTEDLPQTLQCFYEQAVRREDPESRAEALAAMADPAMRITEVWIQNPDNGLSWWATDEVWNDEPVMESVQEDEEPCYIAMREEPRKALLRALEVSKDRVPEPGETCFQVMIEWQEMEEEDNWQSYSGYFSFADGVLPEEMVK